MSNRFRTSQPSLSLSTAKITRISLSRSSKALSSICLFSKSLGLLTFTTFSGAKSPCSSRAKSAPLIALSSMMKAKARERVSSPSEAALSASNASPVSPATIAVNAASLSPLSLIVLDFIRITGLQCSPCASATLRRYWLRTIACIIRASGGKSACRNSMSLNSRLPETVAANSRTKSCRHTSPGSRRCSGPRSR